MAGSGEIWRQRDRFRFIRGAQCLTPESGEGVNSPELAHCGSRCGRAKPVTARDDLDINVKLHLTGRPGQSAELPPLVTNW
jgi:hypothetical protein